MDTGLTSATTRDRAKHASGVANSATIKQNAGKEIYPTKEAEIATAETTGTEGDLGRVRLREVGGEILSADAWMRLRISEGEEVAIETSIKTE